MSPARLPNGNGATMTQAPTPTADTVRRLVLSLLNDAKAGKNGKDSKASEGSNEASKAATGTEDAQGGRRGEEPRPGGSTPGPDVRPATPGAEPVTWWVGSRHVLRLAPDREATLRRRRELRLVQPRIRPAGS